MGMDIQKVISDRDREVVAARLADEQLIEYRGNKKSAYTAAGVNSATWERALAGLPIKPTSLVQIVTALWPESGGRWDAVPPAGEPDRTAGREDDERLDDLERRLRHLEQQVADLMKPGKASKVVVTRIDDDEDSVQLRTELDQPRSRARGRTNPDR